MLDARGRPRAGRRAATEGGRCCQPKPAAGRRRLSAGVRGAAGSGPRSKSSNMPANGRMVDRLALVVGQQILLADIGDVGALRILGEQMVEGLVLGRPDVLGDRLIPFLADWRRPDRCRRSRRGNRTCGAGPRRRSRSGHGRSGGALGSRASSNGMLSAWVIAPYVVCAARGTASEALRPALRTCLASARALR